jgi:hypothetical protein
MMREQDYMTETLQKMEDNRDENQKLLKQKKSLIIKQISAASPLKQSLKVKQTHKTYGHQEYKLYSIQQTSC